MDQPQEPNKILSVELLDDMFTRDRHVYAMLPDAVREVVDRHRQARIRCTVTGHIKNITRDELDHVHGLIVNLYAAEDTCASLGQNIAQAVLVMRAVAEVR